MPKLELHSPLLLKEFNLQISNILWANDEIEIELFYESRKDLCEFLGWDIHELWAKWCVQKYAI